MSEPKKDPTRSLTSNFTEKTLQRSIVAKHRMTRKRQIRGLFLMKTPFLKQPIGALIALFIVAAGSAGVYAAMNWFNGSVNVASDASIMTVDLSQCTSQLPAGVEQTSDRKNVQFKITGTPHIDAAALQRKLLTQCESDSVDKFYTALYPDTPIGERPSTIKAITPYTVTLEVFWDNTYTDRTFNLRNDTSFYALGQPSSLKDMKIGDTVVYVYDHPTGEFDESKNPMDKIHSVKSIFKTQYDTKEVYDKSAGLSYEKTNILPLDWYNQLHKK